jgi:hypothetical protein
MDLFSVVKLAKPTQVTVGVCPLRDGETPILEATAERTMEFVQEEPANASPVVLEVTPMRSVPTQGVQSPEPSRTDSSESMGIFKAESDAEEACQGVKCKKASGNDGEGTSKRRRHIITVDVSSEEDASPSTAAQDTTETPPPQVSNETFAFFFFFFFF